MLTRIGALLRQAESTDNPHEGEAFMAAAQRLATSSAIDLAVARAHTASSEKRATPTQRLITIGEPGKRGLRTYAQLFIAIAAANDVQCDIAQTSAVIYAYGFAGDIDVCEALYSSLLFQMVCATPTRTCVPGRTAAKRPCGPSSKLVDDDASARRSASRWPE